MEVHKMKKLFSIILMGTIGCGLVACSSNTEAVPQDIAITEKPTTEKAPTEKPIEEMDKKPMPGGMGGEMGGGLGGQAADTSWIQNKETDIAYSNVSDTQKLDIYYPNEASTEPYPVIVAIHGGAFKMGSKTGGDLQSMLEGVNHGYAVVTVDYRLSGEEIFPGAISDVKAAIRFIKANAEKYNLDANKIAVWGDSAGGNLAALVGTSGDDDTLNGDNTLNLEYDSTVQAVVDWFGPIDFLKMDEQFAELGTTPKMGLTNSDTSPESQYIGGNITQNVEQTQKSNPENYITANDPYFFIQHGNADPMVPTAQSINFADKLTAVLGEDKVSLEILDGAGHGGDQFETEENVSKVYAFLDSILKK